ncbi:MAG TPA: amidohydrolase [Acidobacteriota bacterium]|nr:amidohydrolase [Acidobacteriota bacterium]
MARDISGADLILADAHIITLDPLRPRASWLGISNGRILALGDNQGLKRLRGGKYNVINCRGKTIVPGFIDSHCHLIAFAETQVTLDLSPRNGVNSISDLKDKIRSAANRLAPGIWIRGKGYNEFYLAERRHPTRWDLDEVASNLPVKLSHRSGHAHVLNSVALRLVGISKETPDPPGGLIEREIPSGEPTGLLYAMGAFLSKSVPPLDIEELERGIKVADQELISLGITSIHESSASNDMERWKLIDSWKQKRLLTPRVCMMLGMESFHENQRHKFSTQLSENHLRLSGVKIILDETTGQLYPPQSKLNEVVFQIHHAGQQTAIHAIEENAIESACTAVAYALERLPRSDHRHRVEHCSLCPPALVKRLASLGIMVITQPPFLFYNGDRYLKTVPSKQLKYLYPIGTLMKSGVEVAGSSDCPIVPPNPLVGIHSAVNRICETGEPVSELEGITPMEALRMYTSYAARTSFEETIKGSISPGKLADLVVLNRDPTKVPSDEIKDIKVEMTILGGEVVWDKTS